MISIVIICNDCGTEVKTGRYTPSVARVYVRPMGWRHIRPGLDLCPVCAVARAKKEREENPDGYV